MSGVGEWRGEIAAKFGGILKHIDVGISDANEIRANVQSRFLSKSWEGVTVDDQLQWLLEEEYRLYLRQSANAGPVFLHNAKNFTTEHPGMYPLLESLFPVESVTSDVWTVLSILESSLAQGRRTRAGGSLETHLEFLLQIAGFKLNHSFATQVEVHGNNKVRLDFLFPADASQLVSNPNSVVTCACMTTVNDRVRLAIQQLQPNTCRRVPTAHGAAQFDTQMKNLGGRLEFARKNQFKFVVFPQAFEYYEGHHTLMTYQEWFDELKKFSLLW